MKYHLTLLCTSPYLGIWNLILLSSKRLHLVSLTYGTQIFKLWSHIQVTTKNRQMAYKMILSKYIQNKTLKTKTFKFYRRI